MTDIFSSERFVNLYRFLFVLVFLFLQACQHNGQSQEQQPEQQEQLQEDKASQKNKLATAASYNTQLGLAYLKQGDRPRAKRKLLQALTQDPNSPDVNASMAYFMEKSGEFEEAENYYKKAMALAPGSGAQLNNYGTYLCRKGQYKQAEAYFLQAVKDLKYEHTAGAYENAGLCAMAIPEAEKAAHYFEKALEQDPARKQSLYELVSVQTKQGHFREALNLLQKYPAVALEDSHLLTQGIAISEQLGETKLEADYKMRLSHISENTGGNNEHNNNG